MFLTQLILVQVVASPCLMSKPLFIEQQLKPEHMAEGYPVTVSF